MDYKQRQMFDQAGRFNNSPDNNQPNIGASSGQKLKWPTISGNYPINNPRPMPQEYNQKNSMQGRTKPGKSPQGKPIQQNSPQEMQEKTTLNTVSNSMSFRRDTPNTTTDTIISNDRLQEAIIWSEILGKPLSKRRKRRFE